MVDSGFDKIDLLSQALLLFQRKWSMELAPWRRVQRDVNVDRQGSGFIYYCSLFYIGVEVENSMQQGHCFFVKDRDAFPSTFPLRRDNGF